MDSLCQTLLILVSFPKIIFLYLFFFNVAQYDRIQKRSLFLRYCFGFRDYLTSLSLNGFPVSNFVNFGFFPQIIFLYWFFLVKHNVTAFRNGSLFSRICFGFRDNLTSLSLNGFPVSNFVNFGFVPQFN